MANHDRPQDEQAILPEESDVMMASFEQAIANHDQQHYSLRLYIAGATSRSRQAIENLKAVCEIHLQGRYELEVIDVYQSPLQMQRDNVLALPTLVKKLPLPLRHIIGDLSNIEKVLVGLDLVPK
jgi:circadian clock protein KaiB